ncbi:phosphatidylglycerol:prolipoprotein diacylglycerol transferase [Caulobacter ginsengisoli]|uniref:Phosphatidylglycerol--prolipoprotein diacylglyceryl transferase n=1 Tax=Caulobacter ginsengisoli TaxID=400775 RepID=A0ABU0IVJ6_9CAUL|nr:phosphatidylglycerol:prolipoprotein diacylglycerol transferase [Caulobacter ginsengisoli]
MDFPPITPFVPFLHWTTQWGEIGLRWYALAYVAGILLGWRYVVNLVRQDRLWGGQTPVITVPQIDDLVLWVTLGVIAGGRIGYILFYMLVQPEQRSALFDNPMMVFEIWKGGMSFHGGLLGVVVAVIGFALANKIDLFKLGDLIAPAAPIGLFFGRIANFVNGELWGRETSLPWGIIFPDAPGGAPRHPSQIYEALLEGLLLFVVLRVATHRQLWLQKRGALVGLFFTGYGLCRIVLENTREPDQGMPEFPFGLTMGMILSLPMLAFGLWMLWNSFRASPPAILAAAVETVPEPEPAPAAQSASKKPARPRKPRTAK